MRSLSGPSASSPSAARSKSRLILPRRFTRVHQQSPLLRLIEEERERWPKSLALIRHAFSKYNRISHEKHVLPAYKIFKPAFDKSYFLDPIKEIIRPDLPKEIMHGDWPNQELVELALDAWDAIQEIMQGISDAETPLEELGLTQAEQTGPRIDEVLPRPDIIYRSPYYRVEQTESGIAKARTNIADVLRWKDPDIREKEHGESTIYNDWRIFFTLNPRKAIQYNQDPHGFRYPDGESEYDVWARASKFLGTLARKHAGENVEVYTHHLAILGLRAEIEHWSKEEFIRVNREETPLNCGITRYTNKGKGQRTGLDRLVLDFYNKIFYDCPSKSTFEV